MQFSDRRKLQAPGVQSLDQTAHMGLKFARVGRYIIAAGSTRQEGQDSFGPALYIGIVGEKGWATHYPLDGKFANEHEAAAAALHYGTQIVTGQVKDTFPPNEPLPLGVVAEARPPGLRLMRF